MTLRTLSVSRSSRVDSCRVTSCFLIFCSERGRDNADRLRRDKGAGILRVQDVDGATNEVAMTATGGTLCRHWYDPATKSRQRTELTRVGPHDD